jgi:hypothetical protein
MKNAILSLSLFSPGLFENPHFVSYRQKSFVKEAVSNQPNQKPERAGLRQ